MKSNPNTLAFTTAALLASSLPFMLLGLVSTLASALMFLSPASAESAILLMVALVLALPLAWLSLRVLLDVQILRHWAKDNSEPACGDIDESLLELGMIKTFQPRDLLTRARACLALQKKLCLLVSAQWAIFLAALVARMTF